MFYDGRLLAALSISLRMQIECFLISIEKFLVDMMASVLKNIEYHLFGGGLLPQESTDGMHCDFCRLPARKMKHPGRDAAERYARTSLRRHDQPALLPELNPGTFI